MMPTSDPFAPHPLFVYGTLRSDCCTAASRMLRAGLVSIGPATTGGQLLDLGEYPGLVHAPQDSRVRGELLVCSATDYPARLRRLDEYEGCNFAQPEDGLYRRVKSTAVLDADGSHVTCWIYIYNREVDRAQRITSGCWRTHLDQRR